MRSTDASTNKVTTFVSSINCGSSQVDSGLINSSVPRIIDHKPGENFTFCAVEYSCSFSNTPLYDCIVNESILLDPLFEIPGSDVNSVHVTEDAVNVKKDLIV
ncbi:uncharacterized protein LOC112689464 [Sipha flava]|uniref:Uncharacterized protein LOC112689464 n=1 Tax=Sipha flava TaxID=143950 RepID=A0A8B8G8A6_9HEMI|nr:uncharacterized protein LOC112689464 [Sipha flava]